MNARIDHQGVSDGGGVDLLKAVELETFDGAIKEGRFPGAYKNGLVKVSVLPGRDNLEINDVVVYAEEWLR